MFTAFTWSPDTVWLLLQKAWWFLVVLGVFSFRDLGVDLFPRSDPATVNISISLPGATPEEMATQVVLPIEEAVNILAARPADIAGVTDRGRLLPGQAADIVLFDPATVRDGPREFVNDLPGGGKRLIQRARGIEAVFVNGVRVRERDRDTGDLGGRVLRSTWYDRPARA